MDEIGTASDERDRRARLRSTRARIIRPRTENVGRISHRRLTVLSLEEPPFDVERPRTRADCASVARPCPWVGCHHSLYLEVSARNGSIKLRFPDLGPEEMAPDRSCALDVAERGGVSLRETAECLNVVRERVRQIEQSGRATISRRHPELRGLLEHVEDKGRAVLEPKSTPLAVSATPMPIRPLFATPPERRTPVSDEDEPSAEVGVDEAEEESAPMPLDLRERVVAILEQRGPLSMRALATAAETGPQPLRDLVRDLRDEGTVHMVGKGAAARWALVGEARPALDAPPAELAPPSTRLDAAESNGSHLLVPGMNGAHVPRGAPTTDRATVRLLAAYERARRALVERRRALVDELEAIDSQLEASHLVPERKAPDRQPSLHSQ